MALYGQRGDQPNAEVDVRPARELAVRGAGLAADQDDTWPDAD